MENDKRTVEGNPEKIERFEYPEIIEVGTLAYAKKHRNDAPPAPDRPALEDYDFECDMVLNDALLKEFVATNMQGVRKGYLVAAIIFFIITIISFVIARSNITLLWTTSAFTFFAVLVYFFGHKVSGWKFARDQRKLHNGEPQRRILRFGEWIELTIMLSGKVKAYDYSSIDKIVESEHLYIVDTLEKKTLVIVKDCFTRGTFEEFQAFLMDKLKKGKEE